MLYKYAPMGTRERRERGLLIRYFGSGRCGTMDRRVLAATLDVVGLCYALGADVQERMESSKEREHMVQFVVGSRLH